MEPTTSHHDPHAGETPGLGDMLAEVADLGGGLAVMLLPLMVTALPGVILMLVLPAVLIAVPLLIPALLLAPPYLLARRVSARWKARP